MRRAPEGGAKRPAADALKIGTDAVNEAALIGACCRSEEVRKRYVRTIPPDYFQAKGHAAMWEALKELDRRELDYSSDAVRSVAGDRFDPAALDAYAAASLASAANARHHADLVRWHKGRQDAALGPVQDFLDAFKDPSADPERVRALARRLSDSLGHGELRFLRNSHALVEQHRKTLEERCAGKLRFPYGLPGLDYFGPDDYGDRRNEQGEKVRVCLDGLPRMIPGAKPGNITTVVGRSGSGKSTSLAWMALRMAEAGRRVLWGSWEQGDVDALELVAMHSLEMSRTDATTGRLSKDDREELLAEMDRLGTNIRMFSNPFNQDLSSERVWNRDNLNLIQQYVVESGCDVFIADLFHMSLEQDDPSETKKAIYRAKAMAEQLGVHMFLVHQLRKDVEVADDPRPTRESISGSGAWIDAADTCLAFHRPGVYAGEDTRLECHVLKQRNGPWPLAVEFDWEGEFGLIENGRTLSLAKPGEKTELDSFLGDAAAPPRKSRKRSYSRR